MSRTTPPEVASPPTTDMRQAVSQRLGFSTIIVSIWASVAPPSFSAGMISSKSRVHAPAPRGAAGVELLDHLRRVPVEPGRDRDVEVLGEQHPLRMAAAEQLEDGRVAPLGGQEDVQPVPIHPDGDAAREEPLDVVEVVAVAGVRDLDLLRRDPLLEQDLDLSWPGVRGRARVRHHRHAGPDAGPGGRAMDLLDPLVDPGRVCCALDEGRPRLGTLDPLLDVMDEEVGEEVLVAVEQELGQVIVGVDTGAGDDLEAGLGRDPDRGPDVAAEQHRRRLNDGLDPVLLDRLRRLDREAVLGLVVANMRPLRRDRLIGGEEVLVDQRQPELVGVDRPVDTLYHGHRNDPNRRRTVGILARWSTCLRR